MNHGVDLSDSFDTTAGQWIHLVGVGIEIFGVFIIVAGIIWSSRFIYRREITSRYDSYKISIGRSLLLALEVLVAADIVNTIAIELTFARSRAVGVGSENSLRLLKPVRRNSTETSISQSPLGGPGPCC